MLAKKFTVLERVCIGYHFDGLLSHLLVALHLLVLFIAMRLTSDDASYDWVGVDVTECIVCVQGHDPLTFYFLSSFLFFDWVGVLWPQLSEVLKLARWARRILFPPVSLQKQVVF